MEQQFQLRYYGKLNIFEQNEMTAEDRAWWLKRTSKEIKDQQDRENAHAKSMSRSK